MGKKKSMLDLMEQVEKDPRFNAAIISLHNSESSGSSPQIEDGLSAKHANVIGPLRQKPSQVDLDSQEADRLIGESTDQWSNNKASAPLGHPVTTPSNINDTIPSDNIATRSSTRQVTIQPDNFIAKQFGNQPSFSEDYKAIPLDIFTLAKNQVRVLNFLIDNNISRTSYNEIGKHTGIGRDSCIAAIGSLVKKGFLHKHIVKNSEFQGFYCVLNKSLCDHFINIGDLYRQKVHHTHPSGICITSPSDGLVTTRLDGSGVEAPDGQTMHISSSFLNIKTTTTQKASKGMVTRPSTNESFVMIGPEMVYWQEVGLQERQVQKWCSEFDVDSVELRRQLAWARWDLVVNGKKAEVKKNVISWIYGILHNTACCYPRPENYKTPVELRAERIKLEHEKEEQARQDIERMKIEKGFREVWSNPDGDEYQAIWNSLSTYEKGLDKGSQVLEKLMKIKYVERNRK